ncbi:MAG: hypothetical protein CVV11_15540, partial [Gammaproteobacteria bacterium HGW-Gammaproteobacteria-15]
MINETKSAIYSAFLASSATFPTSIAVVSETEIISYEELTKEVDFCAAQLARFGIKPGDAVGVLLEKSVRYLTVYLAVCKLNAIFVPLDPQAPTERTRYMVEDAGLVLLVTDEVKQYAELFSVSCSNLFDDFYVFDFNVNYKNYVVDGYIIYTSGSTGQPKGVLVTNQALAAHLKQVSTHFSLSATDTLLHINAFTFDAALELLWLSLMHGCCLHLKQLKQLSIPEFYRYTLKHQITATDVPPAYLMLLLEGATAKTYWHNSTLHTVIVGGDVLPRQVIERWQEYDLFGRCRLLNAYGPTETVISACYHLLSVADLQATSVAIGKVFAPRLYKVEPVEGFAAHEGELHIGGSCLAEGYINNPQQTAEAFYQNEQGRWYRTGDIVTRDKSGLLRFVCRRDQQVKVRGFRVELSEIENQLNAHPAVAEAVVVKLPEQDSLVAFMRASGNLQPDWSELSDWLASKLPGFMVPSNGGWLESLPLLSSGKVDRRQLLAIKLPAPALAEQQFAATELESDLAQLWRDILNSGPVSVVHSFTELGGHSIQLTRMLARLAQQYGVELSFAQFAEHNSVRKLAIWLAQHQQQRQAVLQPMPLPQRFAPSAGQQRMWLSHSLSSQQETNTVQSVIYFSDSLQVTALQQALTNLVQIQPQLRTRFIMDAASNNLWQETLPAPADILSLQDWSTTESASAQLNDYILTKSRRCFDLAAGALFDAELVCLPKQRVLILTCHHIITDGWSMDLLLEQLAAFYNQYCGGAKAALDTSWHYADYVQWQHQWLHSDAAERQRKFWQQQLQGAPSLHSLATDYARPQRQSFAGSQLQVVLSGEVSETVRQLCHELHASPFSLLQTLFTVLIARFSATDDVVLGTPVANRRLPEFEGIAGFFVNSLPLRLPLSMQQSLVDTLQRARQYILAVQDHQDLPFDDIVDLIKPERSLSYHPLFQLMFSFRDAGFSGELTLFNGVNATLAESASVEAKFDLTLEVVSTPAGFQCNWIYATELFDTTTIQALADSYCYLLETLTEQLHRPLAELALTSTENLAEPGLLGQVTSGTELGQQLARIAEKYADKLALQFNTEQLSYRDLDQQSSQLAHYLLAQGVLPEQIIAVCTERSASSLIAILAVLKTGAAYLPVDPAYPDERIGHMLSDSGCQLVLTQQKLLPRLHNHSAVIVLEHIRLEDYPHTLPNIVLQPEQLAYVIYTSGSTGKPKGTLLQRGALLELALSLQSPLQLGPQSRVLQYATVSFDAATFEWIMAFCNGASLHVCDETQRLDMQALEQKLLQEHITHAVLPPALLAHLNCRDDYALQALMVGGEACNEQQAWRWAERYALFNAYGPSECTIAVTLGPILPQQRITLGQVLPTARLYVLDDALQPLPVGAVGELYIGGLAVGRGYLNRPELTADSFINSPFNANERLYKTGDLVRLTPQLEHQFIGRRDHQVKLRGYRVELGEIEACLSRLPQIREAAVLLQQDKAAQPVLVAYYVQQGIGAADMAASAQLLRETLAAQLPAFMVPAHFIAMLSLPRSINGKLDRHALPLPDWQLTEAVFKPATTATECCVQKIWAEFLQLNIEQTSVDANFFALGGHSLLAARVVSAIVQQGYGHCSIRQVFELPTIIQLSAWLDQHRSTTVFASPALLTAAGVASAAQRQMWLLCQLEQQAAAYHIPLTIEFNGELDSAKLDSALIQLIERHDILRTVYRQQQDQLAVVTLPVPTTLLQYSEPGAEQDATTWLAAEVNTMAFAPFDLAADYPIRAKVLRISPQRYQLLLCLHHIAADGHAVSLLLGELAALYNGASLEPAAINYGQYTAWLQQDDVVTAIQQQGIYWQRQLAELPVLHQLPTDFIRPAQQQYRGDLLHSQLGSSLLSALSKLAAEQHTTLYQLLQSSFAILLARYSQHSDIVMGTPVANRTEEWQQTLVGYLVNTVVVRSHIDLSRSFIEQLVEDKQQHAAMLANQQYPFEQLVEELNPERSLSYHPLFQIMFSFRQQTGYSPCFDQLKCTVQDSPAGIAKFDLTLDAVQHDDWLQLNWEFDSALFRPATVAQLSQAFHLLLQQLVEEPQHSLASLQLADISTQPYTKQISGRPYRSLLSRLSSYAAVKGDALALVCGEQRLSYKQLESQVSRRARYLVEQGVKPGDIVGIWQQRDAALVVNLLAVQQAGGAYLPFDESTPVGRVAQIVRQAQVGFLLTDT